MRVARIIVKGEWPSLICFARSLWWLDQGQWGQAGKQTRKPRQEVGGFHVVAHGACTVAFRRVGTNLRIIVWFMMPFVRNLTSTESSKARTSRLASSVRFLVGWLWTSVLIPCYFPVGNLMMNVLKGGGRLGPPPCVHPACHLKHEGMTCPDACKHLNFLQSFPPLCCTADFEAITSNI